MDGCGRIAVPSDATNVWMSEIELITLFIYRTTSSYRIAWFARY